jgi:hypothetical protein
MYFDDVMKPSAIIEAGIKEYKRKGGNNDDLCAMGALFVKTCAEVRDLQVARTLIAQSDVPTEFVRAGVACLYRSTQPDIREFAASTALRLWNLRGLVISHSRMCELRGVSCVIRALERRFEECDDELLKIIYSTAILNALRIQIYRP